MTDTILTPLDVIMNDNYIEYRLQESDKVIYKNNINAFIEKDGVTVQNIEYPVPAYYVNLYSIYGKTLKCGNIINTFFAALKSKVDNSLIIIDFEEVEEVSDSFCSQYYKHLLTTKNKIITINQNINVSNIFAEFVLTHSYDVDTNKKLKTLIIDTYENNFKSVEY